MSSSAPSSPRPLTMIAVLTAAPGRRDELRAALPALVAPTRQEPRCRDYRLFELSDEPALDAHRATPHFRAFEARAHELLGAPLRLVKLTAVA